MAKQPLQGYDVKVSVIGTNGPELVGEFLEASVTITNDTEEYLELGERIAMLLDGQITIEGKLKRGCLYVELLTVFMAKALYDVAMLSWQVRALLL